MLVFIILAVVVIVFVLYLIATYNSFIAIKNRIEEAFATMDVYLQKRYDLIPNLVETVKGYASHEKETFTQVIEARNSAVNAQSIDEKIDAQQGLTNTLGKLFALAESYPDLKANTNFLDLQNQLNNIETEIAQSRKFYNAVVKTFNTKIETFPSNIVANIFKFSKKAMFEVNSEEARNNVEVKF